MDLMILVISALIIIALLIIVYFLVFQRKSKIKNPKKAISQRDVNEINPEFITNKISKVAPSELHAVKQEFIGQRVEVRTFLNSLKNSGRGDTYRDVVLDYEDKPNIHILGEINIDDYTEQSWMTRGGKLLVSGVISEIHNREIVLDDIKIL
mgnify:CR=1 FL=1